MALLVPTKALLEPSPDTAMLFVLSRKFWSGEKIGPGDQNSRKNGLPGPFFLEKFWSGLGITVRVRVQCWIAIVVYEKDTVQRCR